MSDTVKLLPCPFCGADAELCGPNALRFIIGPSRKFWVRCLGEGCEVESAFDRTPEVAVAAWNRRALPPSASGPVTEAMVTLTDAECVHVWDLAHAWDSISFPKVLRAALAASPAPAGEQANG